jgi:eukaryotic-like serine/threonine-protein kinase
MVEKHGGKIGRYRIIAPIGSGGFATVYRAVDERLSSEVALKVLAENHSLVPDSRERFISEAQHLRRVDSYWVASIFDLGETESGQPYMVLELADRGDLETRVNNLWDSRRSLTRDDLLNLSDTLAHSLAAIHAADLVHRDVTPGNLLVRHNGLRPEPYSGRSLLDRGERLLLSDLGYAKDLRVASGITSGGGTAGFAAPEQHGEMTRVDTRADVYGATAVLNWAATGSRYEQALAEVKRIGMADDPADRFPDIAAWNSAVHGALTGPFSPAAIASGRIEEAPPAWARPALAAVAGLCSGVIVAGLLLSGGDRGAKTTDTTVTATSISTTSTTTRPALPVSPPTTTG